MPFLSGDTPRREVATFSGLHAALGLAALMAVALSAACHLRAEARGPRWQVYVFKPLTTAILVAIAALTASAQGSRYQVAVTIGLTLSLLGDIFLMLPGDRFRAGLASFLVAHLAYAVAFTSAVPIGAAPALLAPLLAAAGLLIGNLWSGLGRLRPAVLSYTVVILLMVWTAWARGWEFRTAGTGIAAVGATLFMTSDALLALNRFGRPFANAQTWVMSTYVAAQSLIAVSVGAA
jgi:uncharacterized membrane protein YhhN